VQHSPLPRAVSGSLIGKAGLLDSGGAEALSDAVQLTE